MNNEQIVRQQIQQKINYNRPYFGQTNVLQYVQTDMDHFPYRRYFRGKYNVQYPVIFDREAGYRELNNQCYKQYNVDNVQRTELCFENACSMVKPCNQQNQSCRMGVDGYVVAP
jgi:hypothetical protein